MDKEFTKEQRTTLEAGGFKIGNDGKVRDDKGHLVSQAQIDHVIAGDIVLGFDIEALRKKRQRMAAKGGKDLLTALNEIAPSIALLKVGQTAKVKMPKTSPNGKDPTRQFVMSIVTKLNNLTAAGREWAGRKFDAMSDETKEFFYVTRLADGEPVERKIGAGRPKKEKVDPLKAAMEKVANKLDNNEDVVIPVAENEEEPKNHIMEEEATIIQH